MVNPMKLLLSIVFIFFPLANAAYDVVNFGAKGDGKADSTQAFLSAWNSACSSTTPTQIFVPQGRFLIGQVEFRGPCKNNAITIQIQGTLVAPSDYRALGTSGNWILFIKVTGVSFYGGTLDGQGASFWACLKSGNRCPDGTRSLTFNYASNVVISGLTSINSKASHIVINECQNVMVQGLKIVAPDDSPNTDGIHVQISKGVTIVGTSIKTGDDCVSIGPGATNLWIERVDCGPGHGISIGSLGKDAMEPGVQNVTVKNVIFTGTQNGLRIKSWARPSIGFVQGVLYQDVVMNNVQNPIIIDQNYCPRDQGCPGQSSGVKISQVTYNNIRGSSATAVAVNFECSRSNPCRGIIMQNVKLTYQNSPAQSSCYNAGGKATGLISPSSCLL